MPSLTLTFDNGPHPDATPRVLDVLGRRGIKATFFAVGERLLAPNALASIERAKAEGHWIGNHTFSHSPPLGARPSPTLAEDEIGRTQQLLGSRATEGNLFRPSGGGGNIDHRLLTQSCLDFLVAGKYTCVLWHSVPGDLKGVDWVENALDQLSQRSWTLMVLHDLPHGGINRLDEFLDRVCSLGYHLRQEFPPDCVPLVKGRIVSPMEGYVVKNA
jgi:peptidoglycan/xylan/chitin deacetylase (PgdA/CDA1 family)